MKKQTMRLYFQNFVVIEINQAVFNSESAATTSTTDIFLINTFIRFLGKFNVLFLRKDDSILFVQYKHTSILR